jgi:hypothetical protein
MKIGMLAQIQVSAVVPERAAPITRNVGSRIVMRPLEATA